MGISTNLLLLNYKSWDDFIIFKSFNYYLCFIKQLSGLGWCRTTRVWWNIITIDFFHYFFILALIDLHPLRIYLISRSAPIPNSKNTKAKNIHLIFLGRWQSFLYRNFSSIFLYHPVIRSVVDKNLFSQFHYISMLWFQLSVICFY